MTLVSVVMPMRNAAPFVRAALESVLGQAGVDLEVVVINDGSTDGSEKVVEGLGDPRIRLLPGPCQGIAAALNMAIGAARGDVIARCDADDLLPPGRLARQMKWLEEHPDFGAVCGRFTTMTHRGQVVAELEAAGSAAREITADLRAGETPCSLCSFAVRADVLRRVGGCRSFFVTAEDIDLLLRIGEATRVWFEPVSCYLYRLHDASITHTQRLNLRDFYEDTARAFAAQRREGRPDDLELGRPSPVPADDGGGRHTSRVHQQQMLMALAWDEHGKGRRLRAVRAGLRACLAAPLSFGAWKSLAALVCKRAPQTASAEAGAERRPEQERS